MPTNQLATGLVDQPRELLTVEAAAARLSIGRTTMFALIGRGEIASVRVGRLRRVPATALTAYIDQLAADQRPTAA
ncbi:MAG TPA: excisionase family DNA-binding protein [Pseudonocardiaceae bacterium]|nr:excisionase family DNA-binding protein [Pseudonocardiaceae bacterium]